MTPDEFTNEEIYLNVSEEHILYVQDWGNTDAKTPIVHLHGGPGGSVSNNTKTRYNPLKQRVIFFDQRGCGRSTPYGELHNNTTNDLVEDIEKIVDNRQFESFILTGGSWGATLALAYALEHPERLKALILQGIFTGSRQEMTYLTKGMFRSHFPDVWDGYASSVPEAHRDDPTAYYTQKMFGMDIEEAKAAARAVNDLGMAVLSLDDRTTPSDLSDFDPIPIRIEVHYDQNDCFFPEDRYILNNAHKIVTPTWLVQGRYDFICPPVTAYELAQKMPNAELIMTQAGHANDRNNYEVMRSLLLQASL